MATKSPLETYKRPRTLNGITEDEYKYDIQNLPRKEQTKLLAAWRLEADASAAVDASAVEGPPIVYRPQGSQLEQPPPAPTPTPAKKFAPHGPLTPVNCTLPGFEHVVAHYDLEARWDALNLDKPVRDDDGLGYVRRLMTLCPLVEWNELDRLTEEAVPNSVGGDIVSYGPLVKHAALATWIVVEGWKAAVGVQTGG